MKRTEATNGLWLNKGSKKICYNPWTHFEASNPNGDVTMCPDYITVLGNVNKQSIEDIWNGEKYQQIRKQMYNDGADKMCGSNCALLNGMKNYQSFSWFHEMDKNSNIYKNAVLNEDEIYKGKTCLSSYPRWMRVTISFKCNYNCYHCYQENEREINRRLPKTFISEVKKYVDYYQFIFLIGGEPTLFPEFHDLLKFGMNNSYLRYGISSNGSVIHRFFSEIEKINWAFIAISLDAANKDTYELLRKSKKWEKVNQNLQVISNMKKNNNFAFTIAMTVNSKNCNQIYDFVSLANNYNAMPKINLVSNHDRSLKFNREYLSFDNKQKESILEQIERVLKDFPIIFDETGLNILKEYFMCYNKTRQIKKILTLVAQKILPSSSVKVIKKIKSITRSSTTQ